MLVLRCRFRAQCADMTRYLNRDTKEEGNVRHCAAVGIRYNTAAVVWQNTVLEPLVIQYIRPTRQVVTHAMVCTLRRVGGILLVHT